MRTHEVVHIGTGVIVDRFYSAEDAQRWIDDYQVVQSYKDRFYRVREVTA